MRLPVIKRVDKSDLKDAPSWVDGLLNVINPFIDTVGLALQGKLSFADNFYGKTITQNFTHDVELEINPFPEGTKNVSRVEGVLPMSTGEAFIVGFKWVRKTSGNIGVTIKLDGATAADITLQIFLR